MPRGLRQYLYLLLSVTADLAAVTTTPAASLEASATDATQLATRASASLAAAITNDAAVASAAAAAAAAISTAAACATCTTTARVRTAMEYDRSESAARRVV